MQNKKVLAEIQSIQKKVDDIKWKCIYDNCNHKSINSHLLQQKRILNNIVEAGHLIELKANSIFKSEKENILLMGKVGVKDALSIPLFCSFHDNSLFKEIETYNVDFYQYKTAMLFSYRALCAELRRKEKLIEAEKRKLNSQIIKRESGFLRYFFEKNISKNLINSFELGIKDIRYFKEEFDKYFLDDTLRDFHFSVYEYEFLKVCTSAIFSKIPFFTNPFQKDPFPTIFINIIPQNNKLFIIMGHNKKNKNKLMDDFYNAWKTNDVKKQQVNLTNLFATEISTWGIACSTFDKIPEFKKKLFEKYWDKNFINITGNQSLGFNLFD
jgi:hypothetical protein